MATAGVSLAGHQTGAPNLSARRSVMRRSKFKKPVTMTQENFDLLKEALAFLSPKQRLIVYLRFWDNMTIQEIARYIGHSWNSTDMMLDGAVNHLRLRIIQITHAREESALLEQFCAIAA